MTKEILMNLNPYLMYINNSVSNAIVSTPDVIYNTLTLLKSIIIIEDLMCSIQNYSGFELHNTNFVAVEYTKIIGEFLI